MPYMEGPIYEGIIDDKRFKVWTKMIRRGPTFAILTGEVVPLNKGSKIEACIRAAPWIRYFKVNPIILGIFGISFFVIGLMAVMLGTKYWTIKTWVSGTFLTIYCIGIFLFLMKFINYVGKQEKEDLESFMENIFSNYIMGE
jgi:protein-S-isoprenylcysteine O-methyltransferase Ste14